MQIHILMFDSRVERASTDASKMYDMAREMNGEDDPFGPYNVVSIELEGMPPNNAIHSDGEGRAVYCGGCGYTHALGTKCPTT